MWTPKFWSSWRKPCRHPCIRHRAMTVGEAARGDDETAREARGEKNWIKEVISSGGAASPAQPLRAAFLLQMTLQQTSCCCCFCCCWWCQISTGERAHPPHTLLGSRVPAAHVSLRLQLASAEWKEKGETRRAERRAANGRGWSGLTAVSAAR